MTLDEWHNRLSRHFEGLRKERRDNLPLFALEHGLNEEERKDLNLAIQEDIKQNPPSDAHRLAWLVYAAEIGYQYTGEEYWQTFEVQTPRWVKHGDRGWIRQQFERFARTFAGASPQGTWAAHFNIICWPITHAVLPQYLQVQLAHTLFDLRGVLKPHHFASPEILGRQIAIASDSGSSRFRNFVQEHKLVGQIAMALLVRDADHRDNEQSEDLLETMTLNRIVHDLESTEKARKWLREAQDRVRQTIHSVRGLHNVSEPRVAPGETASRNVPRVAPECNFFLIPAQRGLDLYMSTPDFGAVAAEMPEVKRWLAETRCTVANLTKPGSFLLYGSKQLRLSTWPSPSEPLVQFKNAPPVHAAYLMEAFQIRANFPRLFKVQSDGSAVALRTMVVQPGSSYIMPVPGQIPDLLEGKVTVINCSSIVALQFSVPDVVDHSLSRVLGPLGLTVAEGLKVWPVGIAPINWDDSGYGTWLEGDPIMLGIRATGLLRGVSLTLEHLEPIVLSAAQQTDGAWYVGIPGLLSGSHRMDCRAIQPDGQIMRAYSLNITIRERRQFYASVVTNLAPVQIQVDPPYPSMEDVWEQKVDLRLNGPKEHRVTASLSLLSSYNGQILGQSTVTDLLLPIDSTGGQCLLEKFKKNQGLQAAYDEARSARLTFDAGILGRIKFECERTHSPLRWVVRKSGTRYVVRLIDETDGSAEINIERYEASTPATALPVSLPNALHGIEVEKVALIVARRRSNDEEAVASIIVSSHNWTLDEMRKRPVVIAPPRSPEPIIYFLELIQLWLKANLAGGHPEFWQKAAINEFHSALLETFCGSYWMRAEARFFDCQEEAHSFQRFISDLQRDLRPIIVRDLLQNSAWLTQLVTMSTQQRVSNLSPILIQNEDFRRLVDLNLVQREMLIASALCMSSSPQSFTNRAGVTLRKQIESLLKHPSVMHASRSLVIAIEQKSYDQVNTGSTPVEWEWGP